MTLSPTTTSRIGGLGRCARAIDYSLATAAYSVDDGAVDEVITLTASGGTSGSTYTITLTKTFPDGEIVSAPVSAIPAASTAAALITALLAALQADAVAGSIATFSSPTSTTIAITEVGGTGVGFSVALTTNPSTHLSQAATTAPAAGPTINYGYWYPLVAAADNTSNFEVDQWSDQSLTGDVVVTTITYDASSTYIATILYSSNVDGADVSLQINVSEAGDTDLATTAQNIADAINTALSSAGLPGYATRTAGAITFTAAVGFQITMGNTNLEVSGGAGTWVWTSQTAATPVLPQLILAADGGGAANDDGTTRTAYRIGDQVLGVKRADPNEWGAAVPASGSLTAGAPVFIDTATGRAVWTITGSGSTAYMPVPGKRWTRVDPVDTNVAYVRNV